MIRLALVGYGKIAPKHLEVFRALECEFVACCNRSEAGRLRAQTEGAIPRVYADVEEMIRTESPDGVVCCASLDQVYAAALKIIPFGIPTLLEKPPGTSLAEFNELSALAERFQTPVLVGLNRPHYSVLQKAVVDAGGAEAITDVTIDWSEDPQHCLNRGLTPAQVDRMIFGNSLHGLHLLTTLAGDVPAPQIVSRNLGEPFRRIMGLQGTSSRGAVATFHSNWDSPTPWRIVFYARGRRYCFAPLETCQVQIAGQKELRTIEPDEVDRRYKPGFFRQAETFLQSIRNGSGTGNDFAITLRSVRSAINLAEALSNCFGC